MEMIFFQYAAWLKSERAAFQVDPAWSEIGPNYRPTRYPASPPWNMDWAIRFPDGYYAYVYERWYPAGQYVSGQPQRGYRKHFSFHYGPANPVLKPSGIPERSDLFPAIIRIDCDRWGPHLHFLGQDHIDQASVDGMTIQDVCPFQFMRAVLEHRTTRASFDQIFRFAVKP
jgi:hypothetical protein